MGECWERIAGDRKYRGALQRRIADSRYSSIVERHGEDERGLRREGIKEAPYYGVPLRAQSDTDCFLKRASEMPRGEDE